MKPLRFLAALVCLFAAAAAAPGAGPGAGPGPKGPGGGNGSRPSGELAALEQFLNLSDDQLAQLQDVIARLRAMTPAERAALREEIAAFRKLPEPQRMQMRQGWGMVPPDIQDAWREMMQNTTAAEHAEIQNKMQSLSPEERMQYRRNLAEAYLKAKAEKK